MIQLPERVKKHLPDPDEAERFIDLLSEKTNLQRLSKDKVLLADVITLVSYSPFLGSVILQNPQYISWLSKQKREQKIRNKEELLESLARFSMMNLDIPIGELLSKFKEREFLRIYLNDIRELKTIAEVTEEISDLADAIFEYALRFACQEMDNRYGIPLETDLKGKNKRAEFCVIALGKLGSKELNYASDIDLMFIYSADGKTSGTGTKGVVTNKEYFVKLAELVTKIVGGGIAKSGAYRIDLRLRPYGKVGAIAISLSEAINYYKFSSQPWERQALIRARACAGNPELFKNFYTEVADLIFPKDMSIHKALENVRMSKEKINLEYDNTKEFNVKLSKGGIRDIEFIVQALQIAYGGRDLWLRVPHTLIALSRLADRNLISADELRCLSDAYSFLRRLEHRLQMEQGLQTHTIPSLIAKREKLAKRMNLRSLDEFESQLKHHTQNVSDIFDRVFAQNYKPSSSNISYSDNSRLELVRKFELPAHVSPALEKLSYSNEDLIESLRRFCALSPYLSEMLISEELIESIPTENKSFQKRDYSEFLENSLRSAGSFAEKLSNLRRMWAFLYLEIAAFDTFGKLHLSQSRLLQTELADASIRVALKLASQDLEENPTLNVFGLGKLGGKGMDYGSDLDIIFIVDKQSQDHHQKICETFLRVISGFTREGNLYRIDLRLRPYGKDGALYISSNAFLEYLREKSAIWEWLAYIKLRSIRPETKYLEQKAREIIHGRAKSVDFKILKEETKKIRRLLEQQKSGKSKAFNLKFSAGGKLDVYFATRFIQLRDAIFDEDEDRSTLGILKRLYKMGSIDFESYKAFYEGYDFLNRLDHALRMIVGPTNVLPTSNPQAMELIIERLKLGSKQELEENLLFHRFSINQAFEKILS